MRKFAATAVLFLLSGCAYPTQTDIQGAGPGQLYFPRAQQGDRVAVDGMDVGLAKQFDGKSTFAVAPGTHRVVVTSGDKTILDQKFYVGAGARVPVGGALAW